MLGTCHPRQKELKQWRQESGQSVQLGTILQAVRFGSFLVLSEPLSDYVCLPIHHKPIVDLLNLLDVSPTKP